MGKSDDRSQTFSCMKCGRPYKIYPPQTGYEIAMLEPCIEGCNKIMTVICEGCTQPTTIYWCSGHAHFAGGPIIGSFKSDLMKDPDGFTF